MFKPLLAAKADLDALTFPMIASPKIDGIRCLIDPERGPVTRTMKSIPNAHVRKALGGLGVWLAHLDGEIVTYGEDGTIDDFNTIQSKVMSQEGEPRALFHVFDDFSRPDLPYVDRLAALATNAKRQHPIVRLVPTRTVANPAELAAIERQFVESEGWEGVMLRRPDGPYKFGRSTAKEGILLKVKRFDDAEAIITGAVERMHNANAATLDAFGRTERSATMAGLVPTGSLGALAATWNGVPFEIGTGFSEDQRRTLWASREDLIGQTATFKFQGVGSGGAPRFPVFLGFRHDLTA